MNAPHAEERAVFTQLKPVRMSAADGAEDASVFEDVKPPVSPPPGAPRRSDPSAEAAGFTCGGERLTCADR